ncbi:hypothetical protein [Mudlarkpox virus]|nr:hypothetical protein [Mudlarkpox virus]
MQESVMQEIEMQEREMQERAMQEIEIREIKIQENEIQENAGISKNNTRKVTSKNGKRFRCVMFTIENYSDEDYESLKLMDYRYMIISKVVGTQNLYGYIEFKKQVPLSNLRRINKKAYWEERKVNQKQVINICKNIGNCIEFGEKKGLGRPCNPNKPCKPNKPRKRGRPCKSKSND